jgi:hypothetical protein
VQARVAGGTLAPLGQPVDVAAEAYAPERHDSLVVIDDVLNAEGAEVSRVDALEVPAQLGADAMRVLQQRTVHEFENRPCGTLRKLLVMARATGPGITMS